jgi:RNA polymerase sigma-70 factor, ECF subfamily
MPRWLQTECGDHDLLEASSPTDDQRAGSSSTRDARSAISESPADPTGLRTARLVGRLKKKTVAHSGLVDACRTISAHIALWHARVSECTLQVCFPPVVECRVELSDAELMQRVQAGEAGCFDHLVRRYRRALLRAACNKLGDPQWAEDVVQETFLAAFASRHTFDPRFSFRTWVWTILLNLCRRQWKRRESRPRETPLVETALSGTGADPLDLDDGLARALRTERRRQVDELLARLPAPQADALRLRFFGELPFAEIAQVMECSLSGAKVRVRNGLESLARMLRESEVESP